MIREEPGTIRISKW